MSDVGQTETSARPCAMSVLPSGADIVRLHLANDARPRKTVFRINRIDCVSRWTEAANDITGTTSLNYDLRALFAEPAHEGAIVQSSRPRLCRCGNH
jgi:hypothetical protein